MNWWGVVKASRVLEEKGARITPPSSVSTVILVHDISQRLNIPAKKVPIIFSSNVVYCVLTPEKKREGYYKKTILGF